MKGTSSSSIGISYVVVYLIIYLCSGDTMSETDHPFARTRLVQSMRSSSRTKRPISRLGTLREMPLGESSGSPERVDILNERGSVRYSTSSTSRPPSRAASDSRPSSRIAPVPVPRGRSLASAGAADAEWETEEEVEEEEKVEGGAPSRSPVPSWAADTTQTRNPLLRRPPRDSPGPSWS